MFEQRETPAEPDRRAARQRHGVAVRFHITLHAFFAVACAAVLKLTGPYFADGIVAGLFGVGFLLALASMAMLHESASEAGFGGAAVRFALISFAAYYLASAFFVVWLSFVTPAEPEPADEEGTVAGEVYLPLATLLRTRS